jgi:hypothetical protein
VARFRTYTASVCRIYSAGRMGAGDKGVLERVLLAVLQLRATVRVRM